MELFIVLSVITNTLFITARQEAVFIGEQLNI